MPMHKEARACLAQSNCKHSCPQVDLALVHRGASPRLLDNAARDPAAWLPPASLCRTVEQTRSRAQGTQGPSSARTLQLHSHRVSVGAEGLTRPLGMQAAAGSAPSIEAKKLIPAIQRTFALGTEHMPEERHRRPVKLPAPGYGRGERDSQSGQVVLRRNSSEGAAKV